MTLIENLFALFQVDRRLRSLRARVDSAETYVGIQQRQLQSLQDRRDELLTRKRQRQAHIGNLETEAAGVDERTEKLREDLNAASTTRQYHAVLNEVNSLKDKRREIDEQTLVEMTGVEEIEAEVTELDAKISERAKVLEGAETELASRREEIKESLTELESEREQKTSAFHQMSSRSLMSWPMTLKASRWRASS